MEKITWFAAANVARLMLQKTHADKYAKAMQRTNFHVRTASIREAVNGCGGDWNQAAQYLRGNGWFADAADLPTILSESVAATLSCVGTMAYGSLVEADELTGECVESCHGPVVQPMPESDDDDPSESDDDFPTLN